MRCLLLLIVVVALSGCDRPSAHSHKQQMYVFGTLVEVIIWTEDEAAATEAMSQLSAQFQHQHQQWHPWEAGELHTFNQQLTTGKPTPTPDSIAPLLQRRSEERRVGKECRL